MLLKYALLLSMLFQVTAAIIAVSLIKRTRFNISWILISTGFVLMALRRLVDYFSTFEEARNFIDPFWSSWIAVTISGFMLVGVVFIKRIFNLQDKIDQLSKENEEKVLSAVIQTEEKAKETLARDLHDGLGPILSTIKMSLSAISKPGLNPNNQQIIENAAILIDEGIVSLKEISNNLSPHVLKNYGLVKAVESFSNSLFANGNMAFNLYSNLTTQRFDIKIETGLYRVICELLVNGLRHSKAKKINLSIKKDGNFLEVIYRDNGIGFNPAELAGKPEGMGVENMRSRIRYLGGSFFIDSLENKFTSVKILIPLK